MWQRCHKAGSKEAVQVERLTRSGPSRERVGATDRPAWRPGGGATKGAAPVRRVVERAWPRDVVTSAEILARLKGPGPVQRAVDRTMLPEPCHRAPGVIEAMSDEIVAARQRVRGAPVALPRSATSIEVRWRWQAPRAEAATTVEGGTVRWAGVAEALRLEAPRTPTLRLLAFDFCVEFRGDAPATAVEGDAGGACCAAINLAATPDEIFALAIVIEPAGCRPQDRLEQLWTSVHDADMAALADGTFVAANNRACGVLCGALFRGRGRGNAAWSYKPIFAPLPGRIAEQNSILFAVDRSSVFERVDFLTGGQSLTGLQVSARPSRRRGSSRTL